MLIVTQNLEYSLMKQNFQHSSVLKTDFNISTHFNGFSTSTKTLPSFLPAFWSNLCPPTWVANTVVPSRAQPSSTLSSAFVPFILNVACSKMSLSVTHVHDNITLFCCSDKPPKFHFCQCNFVFLFKATQKMPLYNSFCKIWMDWSPNTELNIALCWKTEKGISLQC